MMNLLSELSIRLMEMFNLIAKGSRRDAFERNEYKKESADKID